MTTLQALLAAARAAPLEDAPRLALADWLTDQGEPDRAEFIRVQVERAHVTWEHSRSDSLFQRSSELIDKHGAAWAGSPHPEVEVTYSRGLLEVRVEAPLLTDQAVAEWLSDHADWVVELTVSDSRDETMPAIVATGGLDGITNLILSCSGPEDHQFTDAGLLPLAGLTGLRSLVLCSASVTDAGLAPLAALPELRELGLIYNQVPFGPRLTHLAQLRGLEVLCIPGHLQPGLELRDLAVLPHLRALDVTASNLTDDAFAGLGGCKALERLHLGRQPLDTRTDSPPTDAALRHLVGLHRLRFLSLIRANITDAGLAHLSTLTALEELDLSHTRVTGAGFRHLGALRHLRALRLHETPLAGQHLAALAGLESLRSLAIPPLDDAGVAALADLPQPLDDGYLSLVAGDAGLRHLPRLTRIRRLALRGDALTDEGMRFVGAMANLQTLTLCCPNVTDAGLAHLAGLHSLKTLMVQRPAGARITGSGLHRLAGLPAFRTLELADSQLNDAAMESLGRLTQLEALTIHDTAITDAGLRHLARLTRLKHLNVRHTRITDAGLAALAGMHDLRGLWIANTGVTGSGFQHLAGLTRLEVLIADHCGVTDDGLRYLAGLTALTYLDLYRSAVTDVGLVHLAGLSRLEHLNLAYSQVTDAGLAQLARLKKLKDLWLAGAPVTEAGVDKLSEELVDCCIEYSD